MQADLKLQMFSRKIFMSNGLECSIDGSTNNLYNIK